MNQFKTGRSLYKYILREFRKLPKIKQSHYKHYVRQVFFYTIKVILWTYIINNLLCGYELISKKYNFSKPAPKPRWPPPSRKS